MKQQSRRSESRLRERQRLSGTEVKVVELLVNGMKRKEISERLSLSVHTVNTHIERIYEKLDVHNEAAAVAKAIRLG